MFLIPNQEAVRSNRAGDTIIEIGLRFRMKDKSILPYIILILPPLFWAGNFIVGRAVSHQHAPLGLSFWRWFYATLIITPFTVRAIWNQREVIRKNFLNITVLAVLSITSFNSLAYISLQYTTATNAILLNSFIPIFILIISALFFKEHISKRQILGISISLIGVFFIVTRMDFEVLKDLEINRGDLWMLLAALDWAMYSILLKYLRPKELSAMAFLGIMMIIGTIILYPIYLSNPFSEAPLVWNEESIWAISYIAIFPSIVSYLAWNYGLQKIGAGVGGQYIHLMPLFGAFMAVVFLDEAIRSYHIFGALGIGLGLYLAISERG